MSIKEVHLFRLPPGSDLIGGLTDYCRAQEITRAVVTGIGTISFTRLAFYHRETRRYQDLTFDQDLEILNLTGNVSLKDGGPMVHAHMTVADDAGRTFGGHVQEGCRLIVFEAMIFELTGEVLTRQFDDEIGLFLWPTWRP
jgi:predicted DNA-binding protein with PD1-like motif